MRFAEILESLRTENPCWKGYHPVGTKKKAGRTVPNCVPEAANAAQQAAIAIAKKKQAGVDEAEGEPEGLPHMTPKLAKHIADQIDTEGAHAIVKSVEWGDGAAKELTTYIQQQLRDFAQSMDESAAWQRKEGKNKKGGLNAKGVASYRREHPGSKLQTAVTTKPSKLKAGSKDAKRRKSFCARMSGVEGPMKKPNGEPTRKALALRKWNC